MKEARMGQWVELTKDIDQGWAGTVGQVRELRGWNFDGTVKIARYVSIWAEPQILPNGKWVAGGSMQVSSAVLQQTSRRPARAERPRIVRPGLAWTTTNKGNDQLITSTHDATVWTVIAPDETDRGPDPVPPYRMAFRWDLYSVKTNELDGRGAAPTRLLAMLDVELKITNLGGAL